MGMLINTHILDQLMTCPHTFSQCGSCSSSSHFSRPYL